MTLGAERPGFFTRAGFLAYNGTLRDPDPIHRGVDIIRRVLCAALRAAGRDRDPAAAGVDAGADESRARHRAHRLGTCGESCHGAIINPIGFAFENFDAMGQVRTMDNGKPIDTSGAYRVRRRHQVVQGRPRAHGVAAAQAADAPAYAAHLAEFALARDIAEEDRAFINRLADQHERRSSIKQLVARHHKEPGLPDARYAMKNQPRTPTAVAYQPPRLPARRRRRWPSRCRSSRGCRSARRGRRPTNPVFGFFICTANGVVQKGGNDPERFWPTATGAAHHRRA